MSKRKLQKVFGLILSAAMLSGCLVGCGSKEEQKSSQSSQVQESQKSSETPKSSEPVATSDATPEVVDITYPLDTDVTFRFWSTSGLKYNSAFNSADESPFHVGLSENTGVDLEWEFPQDGVGTDQAFSLLMTEDELPHIIYYWPSAADGEEYIADGIIWDLTEYLPVYAPDYWEYVNGDDAVRRCATTVEGKHYKFVASVEGGMNITYMGLAVRQDWLDECGLDVPVTLEDWEKMLIAFKEKYGATFSSPKLGTGLSSGTGAYADYKNARWYVDNGNVTFANNTNEYKEFLEIMNRWYDQGLMDPDLFTNDNATIRSKCANNEVGAMYIGSGTFRNILADAETSGSGAKWVGVEHPVTEKGASVTYMQTRHENSIGDCGAMITKECSEEELIIALQFLNYGYTEEGRMYYSFGNEGESYTLDANGMPQWTDLITKAEVGANTAYKYYTATHSNCPTVQETELLYLLNPGVSGEALEKWTANTELAREVFMPTVALTADEGLQYTDAWAAISTYAAESINSFIIGDKSFDEWDDYVKTLNEMGLEKCREIQQTAYDRWLAK